MICLRDGSNGMSRSADQTVVQRQSQSLLGRKMRVDHVGAILVCLTQSTKQPTGVSAQVLLATDGMLVKRPILVGDGFVLVGFRKAEWAEALNK
mgnify:CR=1 FL=1